ncbi:MAG: acyltransferase family protein, partial [Methyloprofundus sp.]|nr:acyltransferase family protein [Methyloprofundus sp.]
MSELRNSSADSLKALAIISVVWIHSFNLNNSVINTQVIADTLRFCVPSFVILWAFFYERGLNVRPPSEYRKYISLRLLTLSIPYFFWGLLHFFLFYDASSISWSTIVNGHFGGYGWAGQFFLVILFQWTIILPFIRRYISWKSTTITLILCALFYQWIAYEMWQVTLVKKMGHRLFLY